MKIIKQFVMTKQFLVLIFNFISIQTYSQIIGHVTDTNNKALAYVNIYIEGTYNGTTSNEDGNYILDIPLKENYTIVFKFLGFKSSARRIIDLKTSTSIIFCSKYFAQDAANLKSLPPSI